MIRLISLFGHRDIETMVFRPNIRIENKTINNEGKFLFIETNRLESVSNKH